MSRKRIINGNQYGGYPLLEYDGVNPGYYQTILDKMIKRLAFMLERHSQVLAVRLVVRFPVEVTANADNGCFQYFMEEYRRYLKLKDFDPQYVWVREQASSHNPHYHVLLLLNGNKIRYYRYPARANEIWSGALFKYYGQDCRCNGLIEVCSAGYDGIAMNHGIRLSRDNEALTQEAYRICSYLAKANTKGNTPKNIREFGASMLGRN